MGVSPDGDAENTLRAAAFVSPTQRIYFRRPTGSGDGPWALPTTPIICLTTATLFIGTLTQGHLTNTEPMVRTTSNNLRGWTEILLRLCHLDRHLINVAGKNNIRPDPRGSYCQNGGAAADIGHVQSGETLGIQPVQCQQAAKRCAVMAGAKGSCGFNQQ